MSILFDIEADGLPDTVTRIWCIVTKDTQTGEIKEWTGDEGIAEGIELLQSANSIVAHNALTYDIPVIKKLYGVDLLHKAHDTQVLSQLFYANKTKSHSIETWGRIFGKAKFKDFSAEKWWLTGDLNELIPRCTSDVEILSDLWDKCVKRLRSWDWSSAVKLEYACQHYYYQHNIEGYPFDIKLAHRLTKVLGYLQDRIINTIRLLAPKVVSAIGSSVKAFRKDNSLTRQAQTYLTNNGIDITTVSGDFTRITYDEINLNSADQKKQWLFRLGWIPDTFTEKGEPSLSKSAFLGVPEGIAEPLRGYGIMKHRYGVLEGWIESQRNGVIHGGAFTCGTNTGRFRHTGVVNVPRAEEGKYLGYHMRRLFYAAEGYDMVGFDFKSLEARVEGHYTYFIDNGEYANWLLTCDDIHAFHAKLWGIPRSEAKVYGYALAYQCGPKKIESYGKSRREARYIYDKYWEARPAVMKLIKGLEGALVSRSMAYEDDRGFLKLSETGDPWIKGIDGRKLFVRSIHSIKNTLIQSAGALLVKYVYVKICRKLIELGIPKSDVRVPIVYHDECQAYIRKDKSVLDIYFKICHDSINEVNAEFKLNVPLEIEIKVGKNWAETH